MQSGQNCPDREDYVLADRENYTRLTTGTKCPEAKNEILYGPAKAANAGGVMVSGFEMSQNAMHLSWTYLEVMEKLKTNMENIFNEAQGQIGKKKKKEREQLTALEEFMRDDFFNDNPNFKITRIMSGGYEGYYWSVEFEGYGQTVRIVIPNMNNIGIDNIKYAHDGMFAFVVVDSEISCTVKKMSYKIEDVAEYIKEYFQLDKVNEDDD